MGQKVNPISFRLGYTQSNRSNWIAKNNKDFAANVHEDEKIRNFLNVRLNDAYVEKIEITRDISNTKVRLGVFAAKPGFIIGKSGINIDKVKNELNLFFKKSFEIDVIEVKKVETSASLVGRSIAEQIKRRIQTTKAAKLAAAQCMRAGGKGIKIKLSGRLDGAEMARQYTEREGRIPLHTLRANIDYISTTVSTIYGIIGIKVWIYNGDVYDIQNRQKSKKGDFVANSKKVKKTKFIKAVK